MIKFHLGYGEDGALLVAGVLHRTVYVSFINAAQVSPAISRPMLMSTVHEKVIKKHLLSVFPDATPDQYNHICDVASSVGLRKMLDVHEFEGTFVDLADFEEAVKTHENIPYQSIMSLKH